MTLVELVITVSMMGLLAVSISAALIVSLKTQTGTEGRLNVARAEQSIDTWMPADLASAVTATDLPNDRPCTAPCPNGIVLDGSSALLLTWPSESGVGDTVVSYMYRVSDPADDKYELVRIYCDGGTCSEVTILRDLDGPPAATFVPGTTSVPDDVINVTVPLAADATSETPEILDTGTSARRIVVTINGGGAVAGAGGGVNRVSITAGGTSLGDLEPQKVTGPSFTQARSRCGGPITIVVDDSGSIGSDVTTVENAVIGFVNALAGTPTQVQIVPFSTTATVIGAGSGWNKYYDMTVDADVATLTGTGSNSIRANLDANTVGGGTNWEDAMFRALYDKTGQRLDTDGNPATNLPGLIVFFTDGEPTFNRTLGSGYRGNGGALPAAPVEKNNKWPTANGSAFDQEGYDRAEYLIKDLRSTDDVRIVGVGVGGISSGSVSSFDQAYVDSKQYGVGYSGDRTYWATNSSKTSGYYLSENTPREKVLGNFIAGGRLQSSNDKPYVKSVFSNGAWTEVDTADMFITNDFSKLPSALSSIALGQCGGTLTLQTRLADGSPATNDVTYESNGETVTTSLVNRAAAFDLTLPGGVAASATVTPQSFVDSGYIPQEWTCRSRGVALDPSRWSYVTPGDPGRGINVTVGPNEAVACTLRVSS
ncbi:MAG: vWA domain-containing protein [Ilumatobacter sp.]|uniref:vWA domain-containing protein n=1 Tax=Ilumatobacter sp. TaxID=1967498 RepID=UPI0032975A51